jgi:RHS repeat-associated protein
MTTDVIELTGHCAHQVCPLNPITSVVLFGAQRVAMKQASTLTFLHGDHLGSTSVASNGTTGALVSRQTYYAFGGVRTTEGTLPTDYTFTGQKNDASSALMFYNARYYDTAIGRFTQADTIVPDPGNPQTLNRYAYTLNNPLKYIDPSGHDITIVPGWNDYGDYSDPKSWEEWISNYIGKDKYDQWYKAWKEATTTEEKMKVAQEYGVAIFDWGSVWNNLVGDAWEAAKQLQKQIDSWGLKEVTVVGHSKGANVVQNLLALYSIDALQEGQVKNLVLIDPTVSPIADGIFGGTP